MRVRVPFLPRHLNAGMAMVIIGLSTPKGRERPREKNKKFIVDWTKRRRRRQENDEQILFFSSLLRFFLSRSVFLSTTLNTAN